MLRIAFVSLSDVPTRCTEFKMRWTLNALALPIMIFFGISGIGSPRSLTAFMSLDTGIFQRDSDKSAATLSVLLYVPPAHKGCDVDNSVTPSPIVVLVASVNTFAAANFLSFAKPPHQFASIKRSKLLY